MAAATGDRFAKWREGDVQTYGLDGGATQQIYKGVMVCLDTTGYAVEGATTAGYKFAGVSTEQKYTTATSADGTHSIKVARKGIFSFVGASLARTDIGRPVWLTDDQTISLTKTNVGPVGVIVAFVSSTEVLVEINATNRGYLRMEPGTAAFASDSTTFELGTGLTSILGATLTLETGAAPTAARELATDRVITTSSVTIAREASGTAATDFSYVLFGY